MVYQRYLQARTNGFPFDLCRFTSLCQMSSPVILFFMSVLSLCHIHFYCAVLSQVWLFATLCTVALQILCPWDSPGKNTGVGCHFLLQRIFPTQGLNPGLLHWQAGSSPTALAGKPIHPEPLVTRPWWELYKCLLICWLIHSPSWEISRIL